MINFRIGAAIVLASGALCGFEARAQMDPAAEQALKDSAAAIEKIAGVAYKSQLYGVGALKEIMDGEGEVKQIRLAGKFGKNAPYWAKGGVKELGKGKAPFQISLYPGEYDSITADWIDDVSNTHFKRPSTDRATDCSRIMSLSNQILLSEFTEQVPYAKQLKAQKAELKPNEQVRGVDCKVVMISWEGGLRSELWWIGAQDNLPRKIEMAHGQGRDLAKGTEIWDLKVLDKADVTELVLKTPPGYKEDFQTAQPQPQFPKQDPNVPFPQKDQPPPPPPVVGLAPGTKAPEFELKANDGKNVKLSTGSVVVLTFGGSMFPKTDIVNATVAEVLAGKDKSIKAYTLACREESEQAAINHAKDAKLAFPLLLGADTVRNEYKVAGFPFTYVLTAEGKVSRAFQGPVSKEQLDKAVDAALRGEIAPLPTAPAPQPVKPVPGPAVGPSPDLGNKPVPVENKKN